MFLCPFELLYVNLSVFPSKTFQSFRSSLVLYSLVLKHSFRSPKLTPFHCRPSVFTSVSPHPNRGTISTSLPFQTFPFQHALAISLQFILSPSRIRLNCTRVIYNLQGKELLDDKVQDDSCDGRGVQHGIRIKLRLDVS